MTDAALKLAAEAVARMERLIAVKCARPQDKIEEILAQEDYHNFCATACPTLAAALLAAVDRNGDIVAALQGAHASRDKIEDELLATAARLEAAEKLLEEVQATWLASWDCSASPGHFPMQDKMVEVDTHLARRGAPPA